MLLCKVNIEVEVPFDEQYDAAPKYVIGTCDGDVINQVDVEVGAAVDRWAAAMEERTSRRVLVESSPIPVRPAPKELLSAHYSQPLVRTNLRLMSHIHV